MRTHTPFIMRSKVKCIAVRRIESLCTFDYPVLVGTNLLCSTEQQSLNATTTVPFHDLTKSIFPVQSLPGIFNVGCKILLIVLNTPCVCFGNISLLFSILYLNRASNYCLSCLVKNKTKKCLVWGWYDLQYEV